MKCPNCSGKGKYKNGFGKVGNCYYCLGTGKVNDKGEQVRTNEEWFEELSTKEKATWLDGVIAYCFGIGHITESEQKKYQKIVADVELWLKQPHTDKE